MDELNEDEFADVPLEEASMEQLLSAVASFEPDSENEARLREIMFLMAQAAMKVDRDELELDPENDTPYETKQKVMNGIANYTFHVDEIPQILRGFVELTFSCDYLSMVLEETCQELLGINPHKLAELVKTSQQREIPLETLYESHKSSTNDTADNLGDSLLKSWSNGSSKPN
jgi:hypothetical protein